MRSSRLSRALTLSLLVLIAVAATVGIGIDYGGTASARSPQTAAGTTLDPFPWIGVRGNKLIDGSGKAIRLIGVNRPGPEYKCVTDDAIFEGPSDDASIEAMLKWRVNAVRLPLNESCWLGIGEVDEHLSGAPYRAAVRDFVTRMEQMGLYVILDLHWSAPGRHTATGLIPMTNADHTPDFWRSVATEYREDRSVLFDLYNEPHHISWNCWKEGCLAYDHWFGDYHAVGMEKLVEVVRSTGAAQPILIGGLDWSRDMRGWLGHVPSDPLDSIVASNHTYADKACYNRCRKAVRRIAKQYPVVTTELGQKDCRHDYVDQYLNWADRNDISYIGWAWFAGNGLTCRNGPILIQDYSGKPTRFGRGFKTHLQRLYKRALLTSEVAG